MQDQDPEATQPAFENAPTKPAHATGPTLPAPELPMIGVTEGAPAHRPEARPSIQAQPAPNTADLAGRLAWLEYDFDLLAKRSCCQPLQPQQEAKPEAQQGKEIPTPGLNTAGAGLLFATSSAGTTLFISKEAMIVLVVLVAGVILVSVLCVSGRAGGAPASA